MKKGKILKIKLGYNPAFGLEGVPVSLILVPAAGCVINFISTCVVAHILYRKYRGKSQKTDENASEKQPQG